MIVNYSKNRQSTKCLLSIVLSQGLGYIMFMREGDTSPERLPRQSHTNTMLTASQSTAVASASVYTLTLELTQHEKILLLAALQDKVDERLKTAKFLSGTDSENAYFQDAGRLTAIARDLSNTYPK